MKIVLENEEIIQAIIDYLHKKTQFEFDIPDIVLVDNKEFEVPHISAECKV